MRAILRSIRGVRFVMFEVKVALETGKALGRSWVFGVRSAGLGGFCSHYIPGLQY